MQVEAYHRAVQGTTNPVFQQGMKVGEVQEYSDTLMIFMLKERRPEKYRENSKVELTGPDGAPLPPAVIQFVGDDAGQPLCQFGDGRQKLIEALRWHLAWGEKEQWLLELVEEGGALPVELLAKPEVPGHLLLAWAAFWDLGGDRHLGFGSAGPILFTSIDVYARRFGVDEFIRFASLIRRVDGIYLEVQRKRVEEAN